MSEQNRKTLRSFYCRDYLWELFEVMTRDLGCSMDYLINEAMRHYARSRNYSLTGAGGQPAAYGQAGLPSGEMGAYNPPPQAPPSLRIAPPPPPPAPPGAPPPPVIAPLSHNNPSRGGFEHRTFERMPAASRVPTPPPQQSRFPADSQRPGIIAAPPPPPGPKTAPAPAVGPTAPAPAVPPPAMAPDAGSSPVGNRRQLALVFNDQRYPINKDKFIIGRASQMTDLTIRDGNVSRKHCAIIYRGGQYYIKDLDSTNGIEYKGSRIDSKKIEEGDLFTICEYELRFTYR